ncbi:ribulose-phosphate 3-epimerase [Patescibacteria group bacterium]
MIEILPTILTTDPEDLKKKIKIAEKFSSGLQIDIGDGKFIPTTTINFEDLQEAETKLFLEIHLMVSEPDKYIAPFVDLGAGRIIFHIETVENPIKIADKIQALGCEAGVALSPDTFLSRLRELDFKIDEAMLLSVIPGKQGQVFQEQVISRICEVRDMYPDIVIGVDGGINKDNIKLVDRAGANIAVVGSAIFDSFDPEQAYRDIIKVCDET